MIRLALILALISQSSALIACLHADQNRIFPIGQSGKGIHVLEIHQSRDDEDFKPVWKCVAYHNIYNSKHELKHSDSIQTLGFFPEQNYLKSIQFLFGKALNIANNTKSLINAVPKSLYFCDYDQTNPEALLSFDTINNTVFVELKSGQKHAVHVLKSFGSVANDLLESITKDEAEIIHVARILRQALQVNSVRKFEIGNKKLTIVHLGIGQILADAYGNYSEPVPHFSQLPFNNLLNSLFFESVLHHGYGFDFMIWE